ncbi:MAG: diguanylate cyclase [Limnochordales bacterium]
MQTTLACIHLVDLLSSLSAEVLEARAEEELLSRLAETLRAQVGCDAVIVRLLERVIQTRVVATADGVQVLPPGALYEPFSEEEQARWLQLADGAFWPDVRTAPHLKAALRAQALRLGLVSGYVVPLVRDGQLLGQVVFAWRSRQALDEAARRLLRKLADFACLKLTLFQIKKERELDPLTGLLNRTGLMRWWESCSGEPQGALLFADLDGFKALNDVRGHLAGDDFLRDMARILRQVAPPRAVITRWGGDEFVLLLPGAARAEALKVRTAIMEQVRAHVASLPPPQPSITIGIALWPRDGRELPALIDKADQRMYHHKRRQVALAMSSKGHAQGRLPGGLFEGWLVNSPDGIIITDPDLKVLYVNPAYERRTGYTAREWLGRRPSFIASGRTPREVYDDMWRCLHAHGSWQGHVINRHREHGEWIASLTITRIVDRRGRLVGYLAISRDVTADVGSGRQALPTNLEGAFTQEALAFALAAAAEMHQRGTRAHLERIREFTRLLVRGASRHYPELDSTVYAGTVVQASILHDIGKIAVPTHVLTKPGPLTPAEFELVKTHTVAGYELLQSPSLRDKGLPSATRFLQVAANIARSHHERWDGTGYPDGLAGEDIPLEARIVSIADVYDALRSERPYKAPWSHRQAVEQIRAEAGRAFDPVLVEVFLAHGGEFDEIWNRMQERFGSRSAGT